MKLKVVHCLPTTPSHATSPYKSVTSLNGIITSENLPQDYHRKGNPLRCSHTPIAFPRKGALEPLKKTIFWDIPK